MAKKYPRKQTAVIFVICLLAVMAAAMYSYQGNAAYSPSKASDISAQTLDSTPTAGSFDDSEWKKQFTDKNVSSTAFKPLKNTPNSSVQPEPLNSTDMLGRNFFTKYVELRQSGLNTNQQSINSAASEVINQSLAGVQPPKTYMPADLKIQSSVSDTTQISKYAEDILLILRNSLPIKNEAEIALTAFEKDDMELLKQIDPIIIGYKSAVSSLLAMTVPQPLASDHLNLINGFSMQAWNASALRNVENDPMTGLLAVSQEVKGLQGIWLALGNMQSYFNSMKIGFAPPGSATILPGQ